MIKRLFIGLLSIGILLTTSINSYANNEKDLRSLIDSNEDEKIKSIREEISRLGEELNHLELKRLEFIENNKLYSYDNSYRIDSDKKARRNLDEVAEKLNPYVSNVNTTIESIRLKMLFDLGDSNDIYNIRKHNSDDLFEFLKRYFVLDDKYKNFSEYYYQLLRNYVKAIEISSLYPRYEEAINWVDKAIIDKKKELDLAQSTLDKFLNKDRLKNIQRLDKSIRDAQITLTSAKSLLTIAPKSVANIKGKLESLILKQEQLIEKAIIFRDSYK